ncbi:major facilitator transporter [Actinoplanes sp. SE50]|uniref:MFS transporter n=1 Tax=unclassified Actinoplanes TaxID=2626549 RepID=UPI00023EBEF2|nr:MULTISPECIES: MFS transporter [unclassified Actinoplanes]AEV84021.1 putative MFS-type transporter [Actinoplanes sp. SE50/110]ATO82414.1 major facilitator transporter [Actinoplanes sp. SE50]SLL99821.1 major facilitator transporter [Actinoplanes sp. SE50/110]
MYLSLRDRPAEDPAAGPKVRVATTVVLLGVVSLLTDVSSEMVTAVLPLYMTAELGLSLLAYGVVDGLYQGVSALVRIFGGYLNDRTNRPKWVAVFGYGISALSRIALVPAHTFAAITGVITADRLGKGFRTAPRDALIADSSDPAVLGRAFGVHRTLDTVGAALGPLVAFGLLLLVPGGYSSVFVASFAFGLLGVTVLVLFVPDRRTGGAGLPARRLVTELLSPRLRRPLLAAGLLGLCTVSDGFLYLSLQHSGEFAARWFPLMYVGTNVVYLTLAIPLGRLSDRVGRARVFLAGHAVLLLTYLVAGRSGGGLVATLVALGLLGAYYAATDGVLPALISKRVPAEARGSGIAAAQTVVVLARFAVSLAFAALWESIGPRDALVIAAGFLVVGIGAAGWLLKGIDR